MDDLAARPTPAGLGSAVNGRHDSVEAAVGKSSIFMKVSFSVVESGESVESSESLESSRARRTS